jgi:hypothetical protein
MSFESVNASHCGGTIRRMAHRFPVFAIFVFCALTSADACPARTPLQIAISALPKALSQTAAQGGTESQTPEEQSGIPQTIVLPKILVAGEKATLAVVDAAGRLIPAVDIDLSSGAKVSTDDTGRATFLAPAQSGIFTARITETAQDFTAVVLVIPKGAPNPALAPVAQKSSAQASLPSSAAQAISPRLIALQDRFDILGSGFSGEAYLDRVTLGNLPAFVLAASPVSLVAQPNPHTSTGLVELTAGLTGGGAPSPVTVVSLDVVGPERPLVPGEANAFIIGVNGSTQRLMLEVRSLTPEVVNLSKGDTEYWFTTGGATNVARVKVRGLKAGNYSLSARLAADGVTRIEIARDQLQAARQLANPQWQKALDQLTRQMDHAIENPKAADTQHAARFRQEIERLLRNHPQDPMAGLLRLSWQSLEWDAD